MKKTSFILAFLLGCIGLSAQNYHIRIHNTGFAIYDKDVNTIEDMRFDGSHMFINDEDDGSTLNIREIDSITFYVETIHTGDTVYIISKLLGVKEVVVFGKGKLDDRLEDLNKNLRMQIKEAQLLANDPNKPASLPLGLLAKLLPKKWRPGYKEAQRKKRHDDILRSY